MWVESRWRVRLGGLQKGSPWWFLPRDRHQSPAQERTSRAGSAREPGAHAEGVRVGREGGTSQGNCEKGGRESPFKMNGPGVPAFLTCVLTLFCTDPNPNCGSEGQRSSENEKVRPVYVFPSTLFGHLLCPRPALGLGTGTLCSKSLSSQWQS